MDAGGVSVIVMGNKKTRKNEGARLRSIGGIDIVLRHFISTWVRWRGGVFGMRLGWQLAVG